MPRFLLAVPIALAISLTLSAADWFQFRGPTGQGHADAASSPPTEWGPKKNVAWRTELPGKGWSSPAVSAGKVYLTTGVMSPGELSLRAIRLDVKTGGIDWNVEVFKIDPDKAGKVHDLNSFASPTAFIEGEKVYVHFGHLGTACLNAKDGSRAWGNQTLGYSPVHGNGGSPVVAGDKLIFSTDGADKQFVVALDKATGNVAWKTPRNNAPISQGFSFSTPLAITVNGQEQVISSGTDVVMALDPKTGHEIWRVKYKGYSVVPRPVYGNGLVYICTGYNPPGSVLAIRPDGTGDVTATHVAWTVKKDAMPKNSSPLLIGGDLYLVADNGTVSCLDAKSGKDRWTPEPLKGTYWASAVSAGGLIYIQSENGTATVFKPGGAKFEEVAVNKMEETTRASYAVDGDALLIRTEKALYRIEKK